MIYEAYYDETGTHAQAPITFVGGYLFSYEKVEQFKTAHDLKLKPILPLDAGGIFHASDCAGRYGKFAAIDKERSDEIFRKMTEITKEYIAYGVIVGIERQMYENVLNSNPRFKALAGSPYFLCLVRAMEYMSAWLERTDATGDIAYLFESGDRHAGEASRILAAIQRKPDLRSRYRIRSYGFYTKQDAPPLQAADLLSWEWQRSYGTAMIEANQNREWRLTLKSLVEKPHQVELISEASIGIRAMSNIFHELVELE
jgi:hypothetical protein